MTHPQEVPEPGKDEPTAEEASVLRLDRREFWGIIGVGIGIFLFSTGPLWRHPWQIDTLNRAIVYSYLPLPPLIALALWQKKRLRLRAFLLDTLTITLIKYSITFSIALVLWSIAPPPPKEPLERAARRADMEAPSASEPEAPAPTPIAPEQTGTVAGTVVNEGGAPVEGALVFISAGLSGMVFAAPETPLTLENDGSGIRPRLSAAALRQPIVARSTDGHLHTLLATKEKGGEVLGNVPLLRSGATAPLSLREAPLVVRLGCRVHPHKEDGTSVEEDAFLGVFDHPFFAITGKDGRFSWSYVPAGALSVSAWSHGRGEGKRDAELSPQGSALVTVTLR